MRFNNTSLTWTFRFVLVRPPQLHGGDGFQRRGAVGGHVDDRVVGIHPNPDGGLRMARDGRIGGVSATGGDLQTALVELEFLSKRQPGGDRVRLETDAHFADFEQARVVIPGVGLADVEMQIAVGGHPGVQRDVAVAQGHRAVVIPAGRIPDHVEIVDRRGAQGNGQLCQADETGQHTSRFSSVDDVMERCAVRVRGVRKWFSWLLCGPSWRRSSNASIPGFTSLQVVRRCRRRKSDVENRGVR